MDRRTAAIEQDIRVLSSSARAFNFERLPFQIVFRLALPESVL
jgi:hypothetical protein